MVNEEDNLPKAVVIEHPETKGKEYFLKTYKMAGGMHESNPDRAKSIAYNIHVPNTKSEMRQLARNPFFSSKTKREKHNDLTIVDLIKCQQTANHKRSSQRLSM